jgi:hypothetical protein
VLLVLAEAETPVRARVVDSAVWDLLHEPVPRSSRFGQVPVERGGATRFHGRTVLAALLAALRDAALDDPDVAATRRRSSS